MDIGVRIDNDEHQFSESARNESQNVILYHAQVAYI